VDTGPLVATADRADRDYAACRTLLEGDEDPPVTTAMVIAEAACVIDRQRLLGYSRATRSQPDPATDHRSDPRLLAGYDAAQRHIADGSYRVALGASGTALLHTVAVSLGERFFGE
jgi:hypothetical protein